MVGAGEDPTADLVPVAFASLSLLQEGPYEGVDNVRLVLLQPVAGPRDDVETEMIPDVESACLGHFLLQEGIPLTPQQQHWRPDMILAQGEGAERRKKKKGVVSEKRDPKIRSTFFLQYNGTCLFSFYLTIYSISQCTRQHTSTQGVTVANFVSLVS